MADQLQVGLANLLSPMILAFALSALATLIPSVDRPATVSPACSKTC